MFARYMRIFWNIFICIFRYKMGTVKGQFIYACVIIVPLDHGSNKVFIECKPELDEPLAHVKASYVLSVYNQIVI